VSHPEVRVHVTPRTCTRSHTQCISPHGRHDASFIGFARVARYNVATLKRDRIEINKKKLGIDRFLSFAPFLCVDINQVLYALTLEGLCYLQEA